MGTKRPNGTVFDTLSKINKSDRKLQPGGKVSSNPSPGPAMSAKLEQGRDANREQDWRREREMEKSRDKATFRDQGARERYYERERDHGNVPRQREWSERERWRENDRRQNVRPLSNVEKETERDTVRAMKKGDTFPKMRRNSGDHGRQNNGECGERRRKDRPKRLETDDWEREYEREQVSESYRVRDREAGQRRRERDYLRERKERDAARKSEKPRSDMGKRDPRVPSPDRQREREVYWGRMEGKPAQRKEGQRGTKSEGDIDEREERRERDREYHHSRSDEDGRGKPKRDRERDRQGHRDEARPRYRDRDREREVDRSWMRDAGKDREKHIEDQRRAGWEADRERKGERWKDSNRDRKEGGRCQDIAREQKQERYRWENNIGLENFTGRDGRAQSDMAPRAPPRAQSSGEWSATDVDEQRTAEIGTERRRRERDRDRRGKTEQRRMWLEPQRGKNSKGNIAVIDSSTRERNIESQGEWGREAHRGKEEADERFSDQSRYTDRHRNRNEQGVDTKTEGVSVDREMHEVWGKKDKEEGPQMSDSDRGKDRRHDAKRETVTDTTEESEREGGGDYWARSESDAGSDSGWKQEKDKMLSGEEDFTFSSDGDDREDRDDDEEQNEDCPESSEGGVKDPAPGDLVRHDGAIERERVWRTGKEEVVDEEDQGSGKQPQYVFCVIGQTLPRDKAGKESPPEADQALEEDTGDPSSTRGRPGDQSAPEVEIDVNPGPEDRIELPQADMGVIGRDLMTERLLMEWRQQNKEPFETEREQTLQLPDNPYDDVHSQVDIEQIQPILERLGSGMISPEEVEAIRIRLSGAWTLSEEPKQHSQAPHLKWAKNVLREILGNSAKQIVDEISVERDGDRKDHQSENASNNVEQQVESSQDTREVPVDLGMDAQRLDPELDLEELRGMGPSQDDMHADQVTEMHGDARTHTHANAPLHTENKEEHGVEKETSPAGHCQLEKADAVVETRERSGNCEIPETEKSRREKEVEMYLSVSSTLYKPRSCPILTCESESETPVSSSEGEGKPIEDGGGESEEDRQEKERGNAEEMVGSMAEGEGKEFDYDVSEQHRKEVTLMGSCSFRDLGPEARSRRRGVRKTTERKDGEHVEVQEEEGVGRDRRTRIFSATGKDRLMEMTVHSFLLLKMFH